MKIAVYCGSAPGNDPAFADSARELGRWIGTNGHTLIYGGGDSGIMGTVAEAAKNAGAAVIGVIPGDVPFIRERPQPFVTELITADNMSARKKVMLDLADAFMALPGGIGTLDEITEVITLTRIGVFNKKSVMVNTNGFYEPFRAMLESMEKAGFIAAGELKKVLFSSDMKEIDGFLKD